MSAMNETVGNDVRGKLGRLVSEHPGGYPEIYDSLRQCGAQIGYSVPDWDAEKQERVTRTETVGAGTIAQEIANQVAFRMSSGELAVSICRVLAKYGLPTPGDARWQLPAAEWIRCTEVR